MPMFAIIDDTDPGLVYTGNWRILTEPVNPRAPEYNGTTHVTNDPTATVSYQFYGSMLGVYGTIDMPETKGYPNASFTISPNNIVPPTHLNQTGEIPRLWELNQATTHVQLFTSSRLATGEYTMTITADGATQASPFYLDFLTILLPEGTTVPVERVIVDDADTTQWNYKGNWGPTNVPGNYLTTIHASQIPGGSATLPFEGTDITVYGTLNGQYSATKPLAYFQVDNGENHTVLATDIPNDLANEGTIRRNQIVFTTSGLSAGSHTLTMVVPPNPAIPSTAATPSNPPWYMDYAVYGQTTPAFTGLGSPTLNGSSPPVGAIAGGVVGGVVVLIALVVFLLWRRRRGKRGTRVLKQEEGGELPLDVPAPVATPYTVENENSASRGLLVGRSSSMHKGGRGLGHSSSSLAMAARRDAGAGVLDDGSLQSPTSPGLPFSATGSVVTGTLSGSGSSQQPRSYTQGSTFASESERERGNKRTGRRGPRRERDGGVRLASGSDEDDDTEEVLPPSYARYT